MFNTSIFYFLTKGIKAKLKIPITCSLTTTLGEAIHLLTTNHIHRLYIVDEKFRPFGIVTISDIINIL